MSLSTLIGVIVGLILFFSAIFFSTDNYLVFLSGPSLLLVMGGTFAAAFISYQARYVILSLKNIGHLFVAQRVGRKTLPQDTAMVIRWGLTVKQGGFPALEKQLKAIEPPDNFLIFGLELVVSGYTPDEVRAMLTDNIESTFERNLVQVDILRYMAAAAPAFGMIGTLIGLIIMLESMGADSANLGKGLAVALVTTLYGVFLARMIFLPAAAKAQQKEEIARFRNSLLMEGFIMLSEGRGPQYMADRMNSFLDPAIQYRRKAPAARPPRPGGQGRRT